MKSFLRVIAVLAIGIAVVGFYRGWFVISTNSTDHTTKTTITVDKDKIHSDEELAKEKLQYNQPLPK